MDLRGDLNSIIKCTQKVRIISKFVLNFFYYNFIKMDKMSFDDLIYCARICDQIENFPLMMSYVKEIIKRGQPLDFDDRNLVSVAFKNTIGPLRTTWRLCESVIRRDLGKNTHAKDEGQVQYIKQIKIDSEKAIEDACREIIDLIEGSVFKANLDKTAIIFYNKMRADYYRYMSEFLVEREDAPKNKTEIPEVKKALEIYLDTQKIGIEEM